MKTLIITMAIIALVLKTIIGLILFPALELLLFISCLLFVIVVYSPIDIDKYFLGEEDK